MHFYYLAMLFVTIAKPIVKNVIRGLGVGVVTYYGINVVLAEITDRIISSMGSVSVPLQMILGLAKVDVAVNIYLAAVTTRLVLAGMDRASGKFSQMRRSTTGTPEA